MLYFLNQIFNKHIDRFQISGYNKIYITKGALNFNMKYRANRMQELRKNMGLSQTEVAEMLSIPKSTYWDYENSEREPSYEVLIRIANFFKVPLDYLLEREFSETGASISPEDLEILKKYQSLSPKRQELIHLILNFEFENSQNSEQNNSEILSNISMEQNLILVKKASRDGDSVREEFITEEELNEIQNSEPLDDDL